MPWDPDVRTGGGSPYIGGYPWGTPTGMPTAPPNTNRNYVAPAPTSPTHSGGSLGGGGGDQGLLNLADGGEAGNDATYRLMHDWRSLDPSKADIDTAIASGQYDDADIVIPLGLHEGYAIHLGSITPDLYKMSGDQVRILQQLLYNAGFWKQDYYQSNLTPNYGVREDGGELVQAVKDLMTAAIKGGKTASQALDEGTARMADTIRQINQATGGAASGGAGNAYVDNPFRVIPLTNTDTLEASADKVAQDVFGRKATADEKAKFVAMFQGTEKIAGQQAADINQQNALSTERTAQANAGTGDGAAAGYGAAVGAGAGQAPCSPWPASRWPTSPTTPTATPGSQGAPAPTTPTTAPTSSPPGAPRSCRSPVAW